MSSDFYLKAQTLYEEFQKKELHYLNTERNLNSSLMWKKDNNISLQEYLQNICQREKKNEETYQSIMEQMNKLDQHTDLLCSKVEKLGILKNIQVEYNLKDKNYPPTLRYIPENVTTQQNKKEPIISHSESYDLKSFALKSSSTQTGGNVYCDNCKSLIQIPCQSNQSFSDSTSSFIDVLSVSRDLALSRSQNDPPPFLLEHNNNSQFITPSLNENHFAPQICQNKSNNEKDSKNEFITNDKYETKSPDDSIVLEKKQLSLQSNDILVSEDTLKNTGNKEILTKSQSKSSDLEMNVEVKHKSDVDSVNHEFDFLESDSAHSFSKINSQDVSKINTTSPSNVSKSTDPFASSEIKFSNKSSLKLGKEKDMFQSNKEEEISDNRSEISGSVSGTRSPVISLSDSDSMNEKGSFTASAAYQSLLGNTVIPSKISKEISDSESEDEVERTLARSVQKSNIKSKSVQPKKDKSIPRIIDSKSDIKSKPVSMNKPQSKLAKSTKKVLGLDTSSSSEIEAAVKPSKNRKDEDSDEFDFYD